MHDEEANFLAALTANPKDAAGYFAFADFLLERDDPRATEYRLRGRVAADPDGWTVNFCSGGIGSYITGKRAKAACGSDKLVHLFTDTKSEDSDLYRFLDESTAETGGTLVKIADGRDLWQLFHDNGMIDVMLPLFSGGHDSAAACHVASRHRKFGGGVHHINTGIGTARTRAHVEATCVQFGWTLNVYRSPETYEKFVRERGFPGPGRHHWIYVRIKERCVREIVGGRQAVLITGCRSQESVRRMGHVEPVKVGEEQGDGKGGTKIVQKNRWWVAPCHDWSVDEQREYMEYFDLPKNPVKMELGMSGECFCGAFAAPGEIDRIRHYAPDVAAEIDRLSKIARECGTHDVWGTRPPGAKKGEQVAKSGPLCSTCDYKAAVTGVNIVPLDGNSEEPK